MSTTSTILRGGLGAAPMLGLLALAASVLPVLHVLAQEPRPGAPGWVEIVPNAIQRPGQPMLVEVGDLPRGARVELAVLRDCDLDGVPDDGPKCPLLWRRTSEPASVEGRVSETLRFSDLTSEADDLFDVGLWLRVRRPGGVEARWARFGYVEDPCSLWSTVVDSFFGGRCRAGLAQALRQHRGEPSLADALFEVRRIRVDGGPGSPRPVPGTRGATGVDWIDDGTLLVTLGPLATVDDARERTGSTGGSGAVKEGGDGGSRGSGVYRVTGVGGGELRWSSLWRPEGRSWPTAPYALPDGRVAFVGQGDGDGPAAFLVVLGPEGEVRSKHPLDRRVHQLVAHDRQGDALLALTLGEAENRPSFLRIDLETGDGQPIGYHHALYHAALRSPDGERSAIAFENLFGDYGWDLVLVDRNGTPVQTVRARKAHDVLPAWRPDGEELAYLAEVEDPEGRKP